MLSRPSIANLEIRLFIILAEEIVQAINGADKVHALRLDGNTIGADAAKSIAQALKKHPEFQV